MKKINIVKKKEDFNFIIKNEKPFIYKDYIVYLQKNTNSIHQFGFSIGKKIGNAVVRNKIKRQLKNILDKYIYEKDIKCIIIVRKSILEKSFEERKLNILFVLKKLNIIKGEKNEKNQ